MPAKDSGVGADAVRAGLIRATPAGELRLDRLALEPDGSLVIEGETASIAAKRRALRLAAALSGAPGIVDRLHVRPAAPMDDADIRSHLAELYALDPRFRGLTVYVDRDPSPLAEDYATVAVGSPGVDGSIAVDVHDGIVILDGVAPSLVRKRLAGALAWSIAGVRDVINGLDVSPPEEDSPDQLEEAVRECLEGDPLFDAAQIRVGVSGDRVRLTGLVRSKDAREEAEAVAWRVLGVEDVINEILTGAPGVRST